MFLSFVADVFLVVYKNTLLDLKSPLQLIGEFLMPIQVCVILYFVNYDKDSIISLLFSSLLPFYIGNLSSSLIRKFSVFFITERQQKFGMYQRVLGLSTTGYFLGNLLYTYLFTAMVIAPVWVMLMYYNFDLELIYFFAAYVICSNCFQLMLISFFKDPKVCSEIVSMVCSLSVFLYYLVDLEDIKFYSIPIMMLPQPGFALSIIGSSKKAASMMLLSAKIYIVIYAWRQFQIHPLHHCKNCINKIKGETSDLNEQIELESLDSQAKVMQPSSFNRERLLSIRNLTKKFDKFTALDGLSLTIGQGEILALLGRNGAGKTTLIDIITGMQEPTSGSINFKQDKNELKIGVCYQQQILYDQLSVEEIVRYYIYVKRQQKQQMQRVLSLVELYGQKKKKVKDLSGGMKRRLSLAIAIIGNPSILILDEPTSGLDPHSRRAVWQIINRLKTDQKSILLTTHHLDEAEALSDRVCVIQRGNILVLGTPMFIKKKFGIGYILTVYGDQQSIKQQQNVISKYVNLETQTVDRNTRRYTLRMKDQQHFGSIIEELQTIKGIEVTLQLNSLEEAFMGILNDPELSTPASEQNQTRVLIPLERSPVGPRRQFKSLFLKNLYLLKHSPLKSSILYSLNIIFLVIGIIVANLFQKIVIASPDNPISTPQMAKQTTSMMRKVMLLQGYYFSIGVYVVNAVYQKEKKIIDMLRVKGMSWPYYWLSQFVIDYFLYFCNLMILNLIVGDMVNVPFMATFGVAIIIYSYCWSHAFNKSQKATKFFPLINFVIGMLLPILNQLSDSFIKTSLFWIFKYFYPFHSLQNQLMPSVDVLVPKQPTFDCTPFIFQAIIYLVILYCIESKVFTRLSSSFENEEIREVIKLNQIKKSYGKQEALKSLSLNVENSQILGLLGPNGAGKSTTFKILTNLVRPDSGQLYLEHKKHPPYKNTFESSGVCYQDDTLWQTLTGRQILTVFGHLVGVEYILEESLYLADNLEIQTLDRKFQKLSGGNKRKCCMAVCLIGQPMCSYLDQCSTGLDPMSRRSMVRTIGTYEDSSIVFTTHSMNEAQVLCKKIAILVKGELKQYGTIKQLKDKYYPNYFIQICYDNEKAELSDLLTSKFLNLAVTSHLIEQKRMKCSIQKSNIKLSELYYALIKLRDNQTIKDFSVYEPNLEDVYLEVLEN